MRILFLYVAEKLSNNDQLLHWELLMDAYSEIMLQNSTTDTSANSEAENKLSKEELITEDAKYMCQKNKMSFIGRDLTNHNIENRYIEESIIFYCHESYTALFIVRAVLF